MSQPEAYFQPQALWTARAIKEQKIGPKVGPKHKIAYYEAKWDFKVPKIHSWVVTLLFYLKESARNMFSTTAIL